MYLVKQKRYSMFTLLSYSSYNCIKIKNLKFLFSTLNQEENENFKFFIRVISRLNLFAFSLYNPKLLGVSRTFFMLKIMTAIIIEASPTSKESSELFQQFNEGYEIFLARHQQKMLSQIFIIIKKE